MAWQPLSQRARNAELDGPYEGIPEHLGHALVNWYNFAIGRSGGRTFHESAARELAIRFRLPASIGMAAYKMADALLAKGMEDDEFFLDLLDATLFVLGDNNSSHILQAHLDAGASAWKVADDHRSLIRVVTSEMQATYGQATAVVDSAAAELKEAWAKAFGRIGDPSDAWDHAIKAVENVLIPAMMPNNRNATLSNVVGELGGQNGPQWKLVLPGNNQDHDVSHLVAMLRLMWPNHDRHGGTAPMRIPSEQEARAVVTLAATIVQWHREGWIVQKR